MSSAAPAWAHSTPFPQAAAFVAAAVLFRAHRMNGETDTANMPRMEDVSTRTPSPSNPIVNAAMEHKQLALYNAQMKKMSNAKFLNGIFLPANMVQSMRRSTVRGGRDPGGSEHPKFQAAKEINST
jgi:hypothetical protein